MTGLRSCSDAPVVVVTVNEDHELAYDAIRLGADDFVLKTDYDSRRLLRTMRYAIERRKRFSAELARLGMAGTAARVPELALSGAGVFTGLVARYAAALDAVLDEQIVSDVRAAAYLREGRVTLLELMGYVADHYRTAALRG